MKISINLLLPTSKKIVSSVLLIVLATSPNIWAATIKAVKGKKVLVNLDDSTFQKGDVLKIEDPSGKTVGLTKLVKIKGQVAEGLLKGNAQPGYAVKLRAAKDIVAKPKKSAATKSSNFTGDKRVLHMGIMGGLASNSAEVQLPNGNPKVSLSGLAYSLKGTMDYALFSWLGFRGLAGLEQFVLGGANNTGTGGCGGECTATINYLTFDFWGRYTLSSEAPTAWIGAGFSLMFPMSKTATALDKESITNTSVMSIGGGYDWKLASGNYIPIQVEYSLYPKSEDVSARTIAVRVGYMFPF